MRVIKASTVRAYMRRYPAARRSLTDWLALATLAEWESIVDVRQAYSHADAAETGSGRTVTIFNIGGNKYRLVVAIHYNTGKVYLREFMTHAEYGRNAWKGRN